MDATELGWGLIERALRRVWEDAIDDEVTIAHRDDHHCRSTTVSDSAGNVLFRCEDGPFSERMALAQLAAQEHTRKAGA